MKFSSRTSNIQMIKNRKKEYFNVIENLKAEREKVFAQEKEISILRDVVYRLKICLEAKDNEIQELISFIGGTQAPPASLQWASEQLPISQLRHLSSKLAKEVKQKESIIEKIKLNYLLSQCGNKLFDEVDSNSLCGRSTSREKYFFDECNLDEKILTLPKAERVHDYGTSRIFTRTLKSLKSSDHLKGQNSTLNTVRWDGFREATSVERTTSPKIISSVSKSGMSCRSSRSSFRPITKKFEQSIEEEKLKRESFKHKLQVRDIRDKISFLTETDMKRKHQEEKDREMLIKLRQERFKKLQDVFTKAKRCQRSSTTESLITGSVSEYNERNQISINGSMDLSISSGSVFECGQDVRTQESLASSFTLPKLDSSETLNCEKRIISEIDTSEAGTSSIHQSNSHICNKPSRFRDSNNTKILFQFNDSYPVDKIPGCVLMDEKKREDNRIMNRNIDLKNETINSLDIEGLQDQPASLILNSNVGNEETEGTNSCIKLQQNAKKVTFANDTEVFGASDYYSSDVSISDISQMFSPNKQKISFEIHDEALSTDLSSPAAGHRKNPVDSRPIEVEPQQVTDDESYISMFHSEESGNVELKFQSGCDSNNCGTGYVLGPKSFSETNSIAPTLLNADEQPLTYNAGNVLAASDPKKSETSDCHEQNDVKFQYLKNDSLDDAADNSVHATPHNNNSEVDEVEGEEDIYVDMELLSKLNESQFDSSVESGLFQSEESGGSIATEDEDVIDIKSECTNTSGNSNKISVPDI